MGDAADPREMRKTFIVPAIKPFDHYDFSRAKIACNLAWLVAKAFGTENVPEELREPFYTDQYDQEHIKPPVVNLLLSAELYCRAGSLILKSDAAKPLLGHDAVIQALAQKGLYVTDQERLVTERDLHKKPIQMDKWIVTKHIDEFVDLCLVVALSDTDRYVLDDLVVRKSAHLAMIDTLMMAYTVEMVSVEKVIACAQQYSAFFQATDLPYDIEDAIMYWINKVNEHLKDIMEQEQKLKEHHTVEAPSGQKARYRKEQTLLKQLPCIPLVENLLKDGTDGCALAALIHFYCPSVVRLEGGIRRSSSMSYVDGFIGTWPKEKRSSVHGVSFDISFDKEDSVQRPTPNRGITRSISNEGLTLNNNRLPKHIRKNLSFKPVNGEEEAESIEEELNIDPHSDLRSYMPLNTNELNSNENMHYKLPNGALQNRVLLDEFGNQIETPSIEEALQIIHDTEKSPCTPRPDQIANGFFLHSQEMSILNSNIKLSQSSPDNLTDTKGALSPITDTTEVDTGIHVPSEDIPETMDEDSSLRDYTVSLDSDMDDASKFLQDYDIRTNNPREASSPCPSTVSNKSQPGSSASSSSGVKMTSFAEQKFRKLNYTDGKSSGSSSQKTTPEGSELNIPHVVAWAQIPEETGLPQGRDTTQLLASEMVHLRMKLEEKRRAIEAQKKKMEAAFTKQRQKMGRTAFLTVVKKRGDGISPLREEAAGAEDEKVYTDRAKEKESQKPDGQRSKSLADIKESMENPPTKWLKSPTTPVDSEKQWNLASPSEENLNEGEILEYTKSIEKLNSSLHLLQQEMQRLSLQDDQKAENDMAMKRAALMEKRLRREKETQLRKQQLEAEMEHRKEETRSESVEGFLSPSRCGSRNGEKDWENASTTSSVASGTEYTGPKLYKEPSAKSNKHIIQNALAHCCLAGKVNEGQKKKILEFHSQKFLQNMRIQRPFVHSPLCDLVGFGIALPPPPPYRGLNSGPQARQAVEPLAKSPGFGINHHLFRFSKLPKDMGTSQRELPNLCVGRAPRNSLRIIFAVEGSFVGSWLPLSALRAVFHLARLRALPLPCPLVLALRWGLTVATCLAFVNSCANPLIYLLLDRSFRARALHRACGRAGRPVRRVSSASSLSRDDNSVFWGRSQTLNAASAAW
ncbi:Calmodulin-regulated spectrin-associated protein 2 [Heterocephalus glaber]|uniref:Calmodulin-regulated spectrin-associated protein 2 n=1 Tax=Heterocephalus glaber TaxID=10181 RepID=G5B3B0_HETGA|nr:Calmodulin-regulated spectrin-associated protein 2 [Heterocephalus glaber]